MKLYFAKNRFFATKAEARAASPLAFDRVEVPTSRDDLIAYLNGLFEPPPASADGQAADCDEPMIDDTFETLPLPLQLHLAALALENARTAVSKGN